MSDLQKTWQYDPAARMVIGQEDHTVICIVPPRQPDALGHLVAAAPTLAAIAIDLHAQLGASLSAWHGEEDSVQEKHADLIKALEAADARASAALGASAAAALPADTLRALAQALLERAYQIDGLQPYVVTHAHRFGDTLYTTWSATPPSEAQLANMIGGGFEPDRDRGESLEHHRLEISELTGSSPSSRLAPERGGDERNDDADDGAERPSGM